MDGAEGVRTGSVEGRLEGRVALVVGAGQTPGDTIGNGRATALLFARAGARVVCVDRDADSVKETVSMIEKAGGQALAMTGDATREAVCRAFVDDAVERMGGLHILHNNVGIGGGDASPAKIDPDAWDHIFEVNLKSAILPCKAAIPHMRAGGGGSIVNVSSIGSICSMSTVAYKSSKAALNAYTQTLALKEARHGIRANVIMPGLMKTPMAVEGISRETGVPKEKLIEVRDAAVPLGGKMGSAWDVAYAALFLASDEARFITGVNLPVDGGQSARRG